MTVGRARACRFLPLSGVTNGGPEERDMQRDGILKPDPLSEIILLASGIVLFVPILVVVLLALT